VKLSILLLLAGACQAQLFTQRGYSETRATLYPQTAPNDSGRAVGEAVLHYELQWRPASAWRINAGFDAQIDTHRQVERRAHLSWADRELLRPALAVRRLSIAYAHGPLTLEVGRQPVRWGKADVLNPTDRFAPRDFLNVVHNEFLPVHAARLTYGGASDSIDVVAVPFFTPSRAPLLYQRWSGLPAGLPPIRDLDSRFPGGTQFGARWNHIARLAEYSFSFFDGYNHQPLLDIDLAFQPALQVLVRRSYPRLRTYGADLALPLGAVTLKSEAAYFDSRSPQADRYLIYVLQLERQTGEWSLVAGYSGQVVTRATETPSFDVERGLTRALVGRAAYTIDTNRSLVLEGALRQDAGGVWVRAEYSQAFGQHWRATAGAALVRGGSSDFLGQFRRNSYAGLTLRYSF
jgi:hypothetical protein